MLNEIIERLELIKAEEYTVAQLTHGYLKLNGSDIIEVESIILDFENGQISSEYAAEKILIYGSKKYTICAI